MGDCDQFFIGSRRRKICEGRSELSIDKTNQFRVMWGMAPLAGGSSNVPFVTKASDGVSVQLLPASQASGSGCGGCGKKKPITTPPKRMVEGTGVGGRLIEMFKKYGFVACDACYALAHKMNEWGVDGCRKHMDEIVADIFPRAIAWEFEKVGWWMKLLPAKVTEVAIHELVEQAIATSVPLQWESIEPPAIVSVKAPRNTQVAASKYTQSSAEKPVGGESLQTTRKIGSVTPKEQLEKTNGWWNDAEVQQAHRDKATRYISTIPKYPMRFDGNGIVITGGGKYFVSAYVTIRVIRHVGCTLPIELWHLDGEMDDEMIDLVGDHGVTCHNACELARGSGYFIDHWWRGWQLKAFALLHSGFEEVLMLDADSYPVRDPSFVFDWPTYQKLGSIIWPDVGSSARLFPPTAAASLGVPQFTEGAAESGQLVVNKQKCWRELNLAKFYNSDADYIYHIVYGDKDTFPVAWHRLGTRYGRMWPNCKMNGPGIQQLDHNGEVLFNHRIHDKFRIFNTRFDSTRQRGDSHQRAIGWQHEDFCHSVIKELSQRWGD